MLRFASAFLSFYFTLRRLGASRSSVGRRIPDIPFLTVLRSLSSSASPTLPFARNPLRGFGECGVHADLGLPTSQIPHAPRAPVCHVQDGRRRHLAHLQPVYNMSPAIGGRNTPSGGLPATRHCCYIHHVDLQVCAVRLWLAMLCGKRVSQAPALMRRHLGAACATGRVGAR